MHRYTQIFWAHDYSHMIKGLYQTTRHEVWLQNNERGVWHRLIYMSWSRSHSFRGEKVSARLKMSKTRKDFWEDWTDSAAETGSWLSYMLGEKDPLTAARINESDIAELFGDLLPDLTGLEVLELASGSGQVQLT